MVFNYHDKQRVHITACGSDEQSLLSFVCRAASLHTPCRLDSKQEQQNGARAAAPGLITVI